MKNNETADEIVDRVLPTMLPHHRGMALRFKRKEEEAAWRMFTAIRRRGARSWTGKHIPKTVGIIRSYTLRSKYWGQQLDRVMKPYLEALRKV